MSRRSITWVISRRNCNCNNETLNLPVQKISQLANWVFSITCTNDREWFRNEAAATSQQRQTGGLSTQSSNHGSHQQGSTRQEHADIPAMVCKGYGLDGDLFMRENETKVNERRMVEYIDENVRWEGRKSATQVLEPPSRSWNRKKTEQISPDHEKQKRKKRRKKGYAKILKTEK